MSDTYKQVIPTAQGVRDHKEYYSDHQTTQPFMFASPIMIREVAPNMTLKIGLESFCRLNPLVKPTFGRARVNNRLFFVPLRTLMPRFIEFIQSEPIFSVADQDYGLQTGTALVSNDDLLTIVLLDCTVGTSSDYDISYLNVSNTVVYVKLGWLGKYALKMFTSLGYKINFNMNDNHSDSALPILAFVKIMIDWYYPSQYINSSAVQLITPLFLNDSLSPWSLNVSDLSAIVNLCYACCYDDSLLVNAWDRPVAPNNGAESSYSIPDITLPSSQSWGSSTLVDASVVNGNNLQTPLPHSSTAANYQYNVSITQYQHDILKALTDYTKRHQLAGVRAVDRYFAEYGINLSSEIMKRSILLGSDTFNIQFGDVMAHSDTVNTSGGVTTGAALGDYSGKGIGYGNKSFSYQIGDEFGYLIMVNSVIPEANYYQGCNRIVKHTSILDFYHHDFDGLGVQAVAADEVYVPQDYNASFSVNQIHSKVFGFVPRYAEYKTAPSLMTGLFQLPNSNKELQAFSLMRNLDGQFSSVNDITHDVDFVVGWDAAQYNRIFYNDYKGKDIPENFIFTHHFTFEQEDDTCPLYDTYDFKEAVKKIEVHTNASKVN